ncbi:hypothetical protein MPTK1_2g25100 [Marchantia polymorpha subsp. ruderalis]|uniref:Uncharacterized protein n=1 Tax=Marchantia polymorpha TaxID=3197 RepID=A0A2R6W358_MARPO|nr:hypothetical protein MARPO_0168s0023 [Marchantia polymorpha]BBN03643.1 hypothetical protein Mp_2g25100 [Marchantia polymorpha subsp. ruderalis]|eukprot:PTQ28299.1 hypothetical protein MARPO_0168s0023 [Marchantia polymorpha]
MRATGPALIPAGTSLDPVAQVTNCVLRSCSCWTLTPRRKYLCYSRLRAPEKPLSACRSILTMRRDSRSLTSCRDFRYSLNAITYGHTDD